METMEIARNMTRAKRRAALRKRKKQVARDFWELRDWLHSMEPHSRTRRVGHWARTPARRSCYDNGNSRRYQTGAGGLTQQERQHLLGTRVELREIRGEFGIGVPRGSRRTGMR